MSHTMQHQHEHHHYTSSQSSARSALTQSLDERRTPSLSFSTPSTAPTSQQTHPSDCDAACGPASEFEDNWTEPDDSFIGLADDLPPAAMLEKAGELPILSANGLSRPFKSLWQGQEHIGQRQLIVFIRHFYCGVSSDDLNPPPLHSNTTHRPAKHMFATSSRPSRQPISPYRSPRQSQSSAAATRNSSRNTPTKPTARFRSTPTRTVSFSRR